MIHTILTKFQTLYFKNIDKVDLLNQLSKQGFLLVDTNAPLTSDKHYHIF